MRLFLCLFALLFSLAAGEPAEDLITKPLPKWKGGAINFRQFAGYLNVSEHKQLFYWYVESQSDPAKDPVTLWLNGGPGCSSLQGMLLELGPFRVSDWGNSVTQNPMSWNRYSNLIFLDAPAGVGFSVRNDGFYNFTDDEVANDNHAAMKLWFAKFPERKTNDFFVMGESYAGTYIPMLASRLANDTQNFPQFKGMAVGNGCVHEKLLFNTGIQYSYNHAFIDETKYRAILKNCCSSSSDCDFHAISKDPNHKCYEDVQFLDNAKYFSLLDPYFLYFTCYLDSPIKSTSVPQRSQREVMRDHLYKRIWNKLPEGDDPEHPDYDPNLPACAHHDDYSLWLQLPELRDVLKIPASVQKYSGCSTPVEENYIITYTDMSDTVRDVVKQKKQVMFFNGDVDSICNVMHNEQFFAQLGLPLKKAKTAWIDVEQKPSTVGYWTAYEGLDFLTIRGAGHFAPATNEKPKEALQMFYNFIHGLNYSTALPNPNSPPETTTQSSTLLTIVPALIITLIARLL